MGSIFHILYPISYILNPVSLIQYPISYMSYQISHIKYLRIPLRVLLQFLYFKCRAFSLWNVQRDGQFFVIVFAPLVHICFIPISCRHFWQCSALMSVPWGAFWPPNLTPHHNCLPAPHIKDLPVDQRHQTGANTSFHIIMPLGSITTAAIFRTRALP